MYDLSALQPFVIGFFVLAGIGIALSVATLATLARERRAATGRVVRMSAAHPAVATRRAA
jgi:hypothetical protein